MSDLVVRLGSRSFALSLGEVIRDARVLAGWSQDQLAWRAGTNQTKVSRIERGAATSLQLDVVNALLGVLGFTASLQVDGRHLADRIRQLEPVHARTTGFLATNFERRDFRTALEVQVGEPSPRGWIDLLAYRPADRALVVDETKGDLPDVGAFQRSLAFYERNARDVAHRLGWHPTRVVVLGTLLDSATIADRLAANRELIGHAFPSPVDRFLAWIDDPAAPAPFGPTLAMCDPASRSAAWLRPTSLGPRRRPAAYADYADAAARLGRTRRR